MKINVQGVRITVDLHILSLVGLDVVLGNAWLRSIGKVITNYDTMVMEFEVGGKKRVWTALATKRVKVCEANIFNICAKVVLDVLLLWLHRTET